MPSWKGFQEKYFLQKMDAENFCQFSLHEIIQAITYRLKFCILNDRKDWLLVFTFSDIKKIVSFLMALLT